MVVIKRDGRRQPFDASKVRLGIEITLAGRPIAQDAVDDLVATIERVAYTSRGSIDADEIGTLVLEGLRDLDEVGYLRFASVYKGFQEAQSFVEEAERLAEGHRGESESDLIGSSGIPSIPPETG